MDSEHLSNSVPPVGGEPRNGGETAGATPAAGATSPGATTPNGTGNTGFSAPYQGAPSPDGTSYRPADHPGSGNFPTTAQTMAPRAREATPEVQIPPDRHGCGPPTGSSAEFVQELPHA